MAIAASTPTEDPETLVDGLILDREGNEIVTYAPDAGNNGWLVFAVAMVSRRRSIPISKRPSAPSEPKPKSYRAACAIRPAEQPVARTSPILGLMRDRPSVPWWILAVVTTLAAGCRREDAPAETIDGVVQTARSHLRQGKDEARQRWSQVKDELGDQQENLRRLEQAAEHAADQLRKPRTPPPSDPPDEAAPSNEPPWWEQWESAIACDAERCQVEQWLVLRAREEPHRLAYGVRVVPAVQGQRLIGYRLQAVPTDSPAYRLGFRSGDEVLRINGRSVAEPLAQMSLFAQLGERRRFVVTLWRDSQEHAVVVDVVGAVPSH